MQLYEVTTSVTTHKSKLTFIGVNKVDFSDARLADGVKPDPFHPSDMLNRDGCYWYDRYSLIIDINFRNRKEFDWRKPPHMSTYEIYYSEVIDMITSYKRNEIIDELI